MFVSRSSFVPARASASMVPLLLLALGVSSLLHDPQSTFAGDAKQCQAAKLLLSWEGETNRLSGAASGEAQAVRCACSLDSAEPTAKPGTKTTPCQADLRETLVVIEGPDVGKKISQAVAKSREFSLLVTISEANVEQHGPARIVSFSSDHSERNFTLGQDGRSFDLRVLTQGSDANGGQRGSSFGTVAAKQAFEVLVACRGETASCYVDGKLVTEIQLAGAIGVWSDQHKIVFGDELTGERDWSGKLHQVAIFDRALKPAEARALIDKGGAKKAAPKKSLSTAEAGNKKAKAQAKAKADAASIAKERADAVRRARALAEAKAKIAAHERVHVQPAEIDKRQVAALSGLRADISSLHTELEALRRNGKSLNEQLAASEKNRQLVQRELAVFLKQRNSGPSDVVEVSRQFATAMKQLSETSQARLVEQQKRFEAEAQRYRSENERTRAEVQQMQQHIEKQFGELRAALQAAHHAKAQAEAEAKAAMAKAKEMEQRLPKKKTVSDDKPLRLSVLRFNKNVAVAQEDQRRAWEEVMKILARDPGARFDIVGHTCSDGRSQVNLYISNLRASNVRDFLVAHGVPAAALTCRGVGETQPVADNATLEGRELNRRVEILRMQ